MQLSKRCEYALRALIDIGIAHEVGRKLLPIREGATIERAGALDEAGMCRPHRVGEGLGQGDAGVGLAFDHGVEHQAAVEERQRCDHCDQHCERQELVCAGHWETRTERVRVPYRVDPLVVVNPGLGGI